jgi:hypothetical protein
MKWIHPCQYIMEVEIETEAGNNGADSEGGHAERPDI